MHAYLHKNIHTYIHSDADLSTVCQKFEDARALEYLGELMKLRSRYIPLISARMDALRQVIRNLTYIHTYIHTYKLRSRYIPLISARMDALRKVIKPYIHTYMHTYIQDPIEIYTSHVCSYGCSS